MAHRKEVFQSKVLQKLYPAAPKSEKELSSTCTPVDVSVNEKHVQRKISPQDIPHTVTPGASAANQRRRMYTVLPPPEDYNGDSIKCATLPHLESTNSRKSPSEPDLQECSEELDQDVEENEQKRRRKRRKRKLNLHGDKDGTAPTSVSSDARNGTLMDVEGVRISRNKKRKLKKKRHKEKMLSMGLLPRASALEFTYQKENDKEEDVRPTEVADFLRTTMEIYRSESLLHAEKLPILPGVLEDLLSSITTGSRPASLLKQLHTLKISIQEKDTNTLENALQDLYNSKLMAAEETTAVATLFQYWKTDILPMKGGIETELPERLNSTATLYSQD